jgi:CubicO group peptidase (beta-lactamase class C family)
MGTEVGGHVAPGYEAVRVAFAENLATRGEVGAGCAAYVGGELVVDLWGGSADGAGTPYTDRTLQMVASATKGALAICALQLVEAGRLDLDAPVARYWPEFRAAGKEAVPVRWLLTHQVGLPYVDAALAAADLLAWTPVTEALAARAPVWEPGTRHGYHALTYGWLVGEVVARVAGRSAGTVFAESVAGPLGLDMAIGLPAAEHGRVAPIRPYVRPPGTPPDELSLRLADPAGMTARAFFLASGLGALLNDGRLWAAEVPAANGMATARALARMYAATIGEVDGVRLLRPETVAAAAAEQVAGEDLVTGYGTRYGLGFQLPIPYRPMAGGASFGHYGLGGSVGFGDPERGFSFGYTTNQMGPALPADPRTVALVGALVECLR